MKQFISALFSFCLAASALGDNHGTKLSFEPRQDSTTMSVTSVSLTSGGGQINAVGDMGEYGRVYTTYTLAADTGGMAGTVLGEGRGALQDGTFVSGSGSGAYSARARHSQCIFCSRLAMARRIWTRLCLTRLRGRSLTTYISCSEVSEPSWPPRLGRGRSLIGSPSLANIVGA